MSTRAIADDWVVIGEQYRGIPSPAGQGEQRTRALAARSLATGDVFQTVRRSGHALREVLGREQMRHGAERRLPDRLILVVQKRDDSVEDLRPNGPAPTAADASRSAPA
ncbi:hypothetical protein ACFZDG_26785 [Kitasatospora xanthocidica]|uniref:hypothetical protein n=1 Tax=Kitasatospora xanthocidica TaxID=83382 RepID=UPI0036F0BB41